MSLKSELAKVISLESQRIGEPSLEDDLLIQGDLGGDLGMCARLLDEIQRMESIRDSLEQLANCTRSMESITPSERTLIEIASNMALAGSGKTYTTFYPSLEDINSLTVSNEAISDMVKNLLTRILKALAELAKAFLAFWSKIFSYVSILRRANARMAARADAAIGRGIANKSITLSSELSALTVRGSVPNNAADLVRSLTEGRRQTKVMMNTYVGNVIKVGEDLVKALARPEAMSPEDYLNGAMHAASGLRLEFLASALTARQYRDPRFNESVMAAPPLMGDKSIFIDIPDDDRDTLLGKAERLRSCKAAVLDTDGNSATIPAEQSFPTVPARMVAQMAEVIEGILGEIENFANGSSGTAITKLTAKLLETTNSAKSVVFSDDLTQLDTQYYAAALRFNTAFVAWAEGPQNALATLMLSACRGAMIVGNKSLKQHD